MKSVEPALSSNASPLSSRFRRWSLLIAALVLVALKLWLVAAQPVVAHANASFDDRLYLALAEQVLKGNWLGPYSQFTLMKGPMYPLFIAGTFLSGLPLPIAQHLLYLLGCVLLVLALRPCFSADWQPFILFALLWWQPMSYVELDILRQNIYTPLTLLLVAGLCALETRRRDGAYIRLAWGALLGVSAAAFYLTREEEIWVIPGALLLIGAAAWNSWRGGERLRPLLVPVLAAVICAAGILGTVCTLNYRHYGWFGTVELRAREFVSAYGAMQRPISSEKIPFVPVAREVRLKLYEVSPSFAELKPCLEGPVGLEWANYSDFLTGRPGEELQIGGGSFLWALRDCVVASGQGNSAREALNFYRSLGSEINQACDDGRITPARNRRDNLMPRWRAGQTRRILETAPGYITDFLLFRGFSAYPSESWGSADLLELFRDLTRWRLAHSNEAPELDSMSASPDYRLAVLQVVGEAVRWVCVGVVFSGLAAWARAVVLMVHQRQMSYLLVVSSAALGSAFAVIVVNMLVHVLAFRNRGFTALHEGYPLLVLFGVTAWIAALSPNGPTEISN
ncbi:MAG: hypothetical protein QOE81_1062 [Verrucomicrobiota bacterium]|jgi:hypothetical protein